MTQILAEQKEFIDQVTNFQLRGITKDEMYTQTRAGSTTLDILSEYEGVYAVEQTHLTDQSGHWIVVVRKDKVGGLTTYINQRMQDIYKNKNGTKQWMVTHQQQGQEDTAGIRITDMQKNRLRTYAEVLRKRFDDVTDKALNQSSTDKRTIAGKMKGILDPTQDTNLTWPRLPQGGTQLLPKNIREKNTGQRTNVSSMEEGKFVVQSSLMDDIKNTTDKPNMNISIANHDSMENTDQQNGNLLAVSQQYQKQLEQTEQLFQEKIDKLEDKQKTMMKDFENLISAKIDKRMKKRFRQASQEVADTVTERMMLAMAGYFQKHNKNKDSNIQVPSSFITQDSPIKGTEPIPDQNLITTEDTRQASFNTSPHDNRQIPMKTTEIERTHTTETTHNDSPHDKTTYESSHEFVK